MLVSPAPSLSSVEAIGISLDHSRQSENAHIPSVGDQSTNVAPMVGNMEARNKPS